MRNLDADLSITEALALSNHSSVICSKGGAENKGHIFKMAHLRAIRYNRYRA